MHELTVACELLEFLKKFCQERKLQKVLSLTLKVNPYSCLSEESLSFAFSALAEGKNPFPDIRIKIIKSNDPTSQEVIIESVEVESEDGSGGGGI